MSSRDDVNTSVTAHSSPVLIWEAAYKQTKKKLSSNYMKCNANEA
jgi:hypothetical protein